MNLVHHYLETKQSWCENVPRGNGDLLAINASPGEVSFYASQGWAVQTLSLSPGIADLWQGNAQAHAFSYWDLSQTTKLGQFHAIAWNDSCNSFLNTPNVIHSVLELLAPSGKAYLRLNNSLLSRTRLIAASRSMFRWPHNTPCDQGCQETDVISGKYWKEWQATHEPIFSKAYQANIDKPIRVLTGVDNQLEIDPNDSQARKDAMTIGWNVVLQRQPIVAPFVPSQVLPVAQPAEHAQIQQQLERQDYEGSHALLRQLFHSGKATAETYNLQGIWHFLQQQPTLAWENFRLAVEKDPANIDFYHNLVDAAPLCKKEDITRSILEQNRHRSPDIASLIRNG